MKVENESEVAQSCPTLSDPMDCSPPGSSIHGIFQARVLEWGAIAFSDSTGIKTDKSVGQNLEPRSTPKHITQIIFDMEARILSEENSFQ